VSFEASGEFEASGGLELALGEGLGGQDPCRRGRGRRAEAACWWRPHAAMDAKATCGLEAQRLSGGLVGRDHGVACWVAGDELGLEALGAEVEALGGLDLEFVPAIEGQAQGVEAWAQVSRRRRTQDAERSH
jgi:hypothetical protein